jgi:1-acyl-sn-glycerol-3-phosphate acyltransferase
MAGLFKTFPYGRVRFVDCRRSAFARPAIVVSNHQSAVDIPLLLSLSANLRLTPRRSTVLRFAARRLGHVFVEPDRGEEALARARELIEQGVCIHFFPEGTRGRDLYPARFHRGAFELAVQLGCDVLPLVLCDSRMIVPRGSFWVDDFRASVRLLPRIRAEDFDHRRGSRELMKHVQGIVREAFVEDLEDVNTTEVLRRKVARFYRYQGWRVERSVRRRLRADPLYPELTDTLPAEGHVLDLGCGAGLAAHWLTESRPRLKVTGHDEDVRIARRSAVGQPRLSFREGGSPYEPAQAALVRTVSCLDGGALAEALAPDGHAVVPTGRETIGPALERAGFTAVPGTSPARYRVLA